MQELIEQRFKTVSDRLLCSRKKLKGMFELIEIDGDLYMVEKSFAQWLERNAGAPMSVAKEDN